MVERTGDISTNTSTLSSGGVRSRRCAADYAIEMVADPVMSLKIFLVGPNRWCCEEKKCLRVEEDVRGEFVMVHSEVLPPELPAERVLTQTRRFMSKRSQSERTDFLLEVLKSGRTLHQEGRYSFTFSLTAGTPPAQSEVCEKAFRAFYYFKYDLVRRYKNDLMADEEPSKRRKKIALTQLAGPDVGRRDLTTKEIEAIEFVRQYATIHGEHIPNANEVRITHALRVVYDAYKEEFRDRFGRSKFYALVKEYLPRVKATRGKGDFMQCDSCKEFANKKLNKALTKYERYELEKEFRIHIQTTKEMRLCSASRITEASTFHHDTMSTVMDGCDQSSTTLPHFMRKGHKEESLHEAFMKHNLVAVCVHDCTHREYLYLIPPYAASRQGSNVTLECLVRTLNKEAKFRVRQRFRWPRILYLQVDNTSRENKNSYVFTFLSYLVLAGIFEEIHCNFFVVGHTHSDVDQLFSVITRKLRSSDALTFDDWRAVVAPVLGAGPGGEPLGGIEFMWAMHNFVDWLLPVLNKAYSHYRSGAYHFKFVRQEDRAVMLYAQYDYHVKEKPAGYFPREPDAPSSWLKGMPVGHPDVDSSHGTWPRSDQISSKGQYAHLLRELFVLPTNRADADTVRWWEDWLNKIPEPNTELRDDQLAPFELPDVADINARAARYNEPVVMRAGTIGPAPALEFGLLNQQGCTQEQRHQARQITEANRTLELEQQDSTISSSLTSGSFVIFKVAPDFWHGSNLTKTLPFSLGLVLAVDPAARVCRVELFYCRSGNPNAM